MNDNWQDTQRLEIEATGIAPQDLRESAIIATLSPAAYTATVAGRERRHWRGIGRNLRPQLCDRQREAGQHQPRAVPSRQRRQRDDRGVSLSVARSINPAKVVVRAIGPSLAQAGISNPLSNPSLQLFDNNGQIVANNNNWSDVPSQAAELQALNLAPVNPAESAIVATIAAGSLHGGGGRPGRRHRDRIDRSLRHPITKVTSVTYRAAPRNRPELITISGPLRGAFGVVGGRRENQLHDRRCLPGFAPPRALVCSDTVNDRPGSESKVTTLLLSISRPCASLVFYVRISDRQTGRKYYDDHLEL